MQFVDQIQGLYANLLNALLKHERKHMVSMNQWKKPIYVRYL